MLLIMASLFLVFYTRLMLIFVLFFPPNSVISLTSQSLIVDMLLLIQFSLPFSGVSSLVGATLATWYSSLLIASLWRWNGKKHITYRKLAESIFGWFCLLLHLFFFLQVALIIYS
jgi:hypothetical protein